MEPAGFNCENCGREPGQRIVKKRPRIATLKRYLPNTDA